MKVLLGTTLFTNTCPASSDAIPSHCIIPASIAREINSQEYDQLIEANRPWPPLEPFGGR